MEFGVEPPWALNHPEIMQDREYAHFLAKMYYEQDHADSDEACCQHGQFFPKQCAHNEGFLQ